MSARPVYRRFLLPLNPIYRFGLALRALRLRLGWEGVRRLGSPVISIGNLSTGGAGKTPFAIALARALAARGIGVDVLSRGYGRMSTDAARVDPDGGVEEFGDEPLLIAREAGVPVYVARQRYEAGLLAEANPVLEKAARVHILDDGFQHRQLHRDVNILLLNQDDWRDRLLPAGNLREPLSALQRADVLVIPESAPELEPALRRTGWKGPVWRVRRVMNVPRVDGPVLAFCGIARPEQFFAGLEKAGLQVAAKIAFRDHHRYMGGDIERLQAKASSLGAVALVTTAKDQVRLAGLRRESGSELPPVLTASLSSEIVNEAAVFDWLTGRLRAGGNRPSL